MQLVRTVQSTLLAIAVAIVGLAVATPAHASSGAPGAPAASARSGAKVKAVGPSFEAKVLRLTNRERTKRHLRPLTTSACTERVSSRWARKLAARHAFHHQSMKSVGRACHTRYVGENIAMGRPLSAAKVVSMWMHSKGHRANILNKRYRHLGVGAARSRGLTYVVQNFRR